MIKWKTFAVGWGLALALLLFAQHKPTMPADNPKQSVIDLSHVVNDRSPNWDGAEESPFRVKALGTMERDGYYARSFSMEEHYGTHIDAPAHFARGMWTVEQIPAERLVRPLVVLDVRSNVLRNPDYQISVQDVADWEAKHGEVPSGAVVMAYTGWESRWNTPKDFRNEAADGLHFPGFSLETAKFLVKTRDVVGLGIDTMSIDAGLAKDFPVHQFTSNRSVYHLENVANLALVPAAGATIVVAPLKLESGSGAPARLLALVGNGTAENASGGD